MSEVTKLTENAGLNNQLTYFPINQAFEELRKMRFIELLAFVKAGVISNYNINTKHCPERKYQNKEHTLKILEHFNAIEYLITFCDETQAPVSSEEKICP